MMRMQTRSMLSASRDTKIRVKDDVSTIKQGLEATFCNRTNWANEMGAKAEQREALIQEQKLRIKSLVKSTKSLVQDEHLQAEAKEQLRADGLLVDTENIEAEIKARFGNTHQTEGIAAKQAELAEQRSKCAELDEAERAIDEKVRQKRQILTQMLERTEAEMEFVEGFIRELEAM